ncbi:MAG: PAS domain S-box protein [SAR324 cluster bacterium]|nr:PAS domain S-box protein [SAR324 cluster bacterium]
MSQQKKEKSTKCAAKLSGKTAQLQQEIEERKKANKALTGEVKERKKAIKLLKRELVQRQQIEEALYFVAQKGWKVSRDEYFQSAVTFLAENLGFEYAFIGEMIRSKKNMARTIALYVEGRIVENVEYSLKQTPSESVIGNKLYCYPKNVQELFPKDELLAEWGVESYIGSPLWDSKGKQLGLIAMMGKKTLFKPHHAESLLQIMAVRAAHELEQNQNEQTLKQNHAYLENLVEKRTIEALKLHESEKKLKHYQNYLEELVEQRTAETLKLSRAIEQSPVSVIITDTEGCIEYINPIFTESTGYSLEDVSGKTLRTLQTEQLISDTVYKKIWETIIAGKEWKGEVSSKKKNGGIFYESACISAIKNPAGQITNYIAVQVDITDRKRVEWELEKAKQIAEDANRIKSDFLANMSHEIRTPLNAILGFSELLEKSVQEDRGKEHLHSIRSSAKSLLTLITDILDLSKIEAGKLDLKYTVFNPHAFFQEIKQIFSYKVVQKQLAFHVNVDPTIPKALLLDEIRLRQIILNLVGNAFKFTDTGVVRLSVRKQENQEHFEKIDLIFSVEDTGMGIPADQTEIIFRTFEQAGSRDNFVEGTGLGLTITKRLVEMMGGHISVKSEVGVGSRFNVTLKGIAISALSHGAGVGYNESRPSLAGQAEEVLVDLDVDVLAKLPELLNILEEEANHWKRLGQHSIIQDIQTFAVHMQELGEKYHVPTLNQWGQRLYSQVFNIETFPKILEQFPNQVNQIRDHLLQCN